MQKNISVVISTYNSVEWLKKVIWGYNTQTYRNFEMVIADDGSRQETFDLIEEMKKEVFYPIIHVWHEDNGFQKTQILNKAIVACTTDYIMMSDGDCIPRPDFVEQHIKFREEGFFLSGGYHKLPMELSKNITKEDIYSGNCFEVSWLMENGMESSFKNGIIESNGLLSSLLNKIGFSKPKFNFYNASAWKNDILAVDCFNQMQDFTNRLVTSGIKTKQIGYSAIALQLNR
jgi:glycosyltransferase involved in cell wall biosynthesis